MLQQEEAGDQEAEQNAAAPAKEQQLQQQQQKQKQKQKHEQLNLRAAGADAAEQGEEQAAAAGAAAAGAGAAAAAAAAEALGGSQHPAKRRRVSELGLAQARQQELAAQATKLPSGSKPQAPATQLSVKKPACLHEAPEQQPPAAQQPTQQLQQQQRQQSVADEAPTGPSAGVQMVGIAQGAQEEDAGRQQSLAASLQQQQQQAAVKEQQGSVVLAAVKLAPEAGSTRSALKPELALGSTAVGGSPGRHAAASAVHVLAAPPRLLLCRLPSLQEG
jgi:hypothetical protein